MSGIIWTDSFCQATDVNDGREQLSAESIIKTVPPFSFNRERKAYFFCVVAILKETVWKTRARGIVTIAFISGQGLVNLITTLIGKSGWRRDTFQKISLRIDGNN